MKAISQILISISKVEKITFFYLIFYIRLPLGYGFVSFDDRSTAQDVLRELNGKKMPNVEEV